ncbi:hypothetical protein XO12_01855 [Marinitoga sp. 1154]|uniref:hypothetical protein n=1 Tax=Marinitoga sp. 1154 TaxID=1643335 RepID=UPI001585D8C5|nr:hypothetical protein [Marinitoga sp. 1154]NUU98898.1 hypothetical protein [Marinitoga sp. 1154]
MRKNKNILGGMFLIIIGIYLIFSNIFNINISWNYIWPLFILIPGIKFEYDYFKYKKNPGILVPGGVLTTIGIIFLINSFLGNEVLNLLWPGFVLAPAVGLFQMYLATKRKNLLFPSFLLSGISIIFFIEEISNSVRVWNYAVGIVFILFGLMFLRKKGVDNNG